MFPWFGSTPLGRIDPLGVQEWITALSASGLSSKTVRECYRLLGSIMRAAVDARLIPQSPCQGTKRPRVARPEQRFLTPGEVEKLAAAIDPHYRTLVYAAVYLGCRWGELAGLKRKNLDLLRRRLHVVGSLEEVNGRVRWLSETKSSASRRALSVPTFLVDMLAAHLAGAQESDFVFTSKRGRPLRRSSFRADYWIPAVSSAN